MCIKFVCTFIVSLKYQIVFKTPIANLSNTHCKYHHNALLSCAKRFELSLQIFMASNVLKPEGFSVVFGKEGLILIRGGSKQISWIVFLTEYFS